MGVGWGVLSTARIAARLVEGASKTDAAEVVAVASRDATRASAFAAAHGIGHAHGSYEALLADPAVEAVYVPLPNSLHVDWAVKALEAGKHVLCEKPIDRRPEQVARAFDAAEQRGLVLSEGFMWRHNPQTQILCSLLDQGAVGTVRLIRASFSFVLGGDVDVRLDPALDGGALMDVGCYCVGGARLVAGGEPVSVSAQAVTGPTGVDMRLTGLLRFAGDVLAVIDCGLDEYSRGELEVVGTDGRLVLSDPWHAIAPQIVVESGFDRDLVEISAADSFARELEDLAAAIAGERPPLLGREDALGQSRTIEALYRSAATGHAVALG
ncbi:MAG: Gfo/Idh/MocA family protein [Thermoleophilia bacterium]